MFLGPKIAKKKPITAPSHQERKKICNQSFETAQQLFQGLNNESNAKNDFDVKNDKIIPSKKRHDIFTLPKKFGAAQHEPLMQIEEQQKTNFSDPLALNGRNAVTLLGRVEFALKKHKLYPKMNALWSVFGQLIKITKGKYSFEHILLLRENSANGVILKCIFYDFNEETITQIQTGDHLRVIGRFQAENDFRAYKVEKFKLEILAGTAENFSRIENIISFVLLNQTNSKN